MKEKSVERCPKCGFRLRGKSHDNGTHHGKTRPAAKLRVKYANKPDIHATAKEKK